MAIHIHCCAEVSYHCYYLALRDAFPLFRGDSDASSV